jgi:hypothetical protein
MFARSVESPATTEKLLDHVHPPTEIMILRLGLVLFRPLSAAMLLSSCAPKCENTLPPASRSANA